MPKFSFSGDFELEVGEILTGFDLSYQTFGKLNADKSNVVWIFHALTANCNPLDWWSGLVGQDKFITPDKYFIVCVNMPGSIYGSINPLSINNKTGKPFYHQFPLITIRDMTNMYDLLRTYLGINHIYMGIGGSMGGMQLLEWSIINPKLFKQVVLIATNAKHSLWGIAFNATQRMAIEADVTWQEQFPDAGKKGLKAARAIAMLSYRNYYSFEYSQHETDVNKLIGFKSESYQYYQGQKLADRFNAFCYYALSRSMDSHNVGRDRTSIEKSLQKIKSRALVIGIESDLLFPIEEQIYLSQYIPNAVFKLIDSPYGHDGFLIEFEQLEKIIEEFLSNYKI
jgi:homoserine O-acetyltransferase